jgi:hypothetical protein
MSLRAWNALAALLHAGFALWVLQKNEKDVTKYKLTFNTSSSPTSDLDYAVETEASGAVGLRRLTLAFFGLTSLAHVLYATDFFGKGWYSSAVSGYGWNPFRWIEYSLTASLMIYVIALVAGAKEENNTIVATLITPGLMLQGLTVEREIHQNALAKGKSVDIDPVLIWFNFLPAWLFFGLKWYIIWSAYFQLQSDLKADGKTLDVRVQRLVTIQFIGFTLFGVLQTLQVSGWSNKTRFRTYRYEVYEKGYILLSFVVKAALGISVASLL